MHRDCRWGRVTETLAADAITRTPTLKNHPRFLRAAKLAGDKRAIVAEMGFGRPFAKVVIAQSGVLK